MFEYENDTWTLEDLQQAAKDQGLDFDTYLEEMKKNGVRAEIDLRNEKIGSKIRDHTLKKVPYLIIVGDREVSSKEITVRTQKGEDL